MLEKIIDFGRSAVAGLALLMLGGCATTQPEMMKPGVAIEKGKICAVGCHENIGDRDASGDFAESNARHELCLYLETRITHTGEEYSCILYGARAVKYTYSPSFNEWDEVCVKVCLEGLEGYTGTNKGMMKEAEHEHDRLREKAEGAYKKEEQNAEDRYDREERKAEAEYDALEKKSDRLIRRAEDAWKKAEKRLDKDHE